MDEYLNYPSMLSAISLSYSASHCFTSKVFTLLMIFYVIKI